MAGVGVSVLCSPKVCSLTCWDRTDSCIRLPNEAARIETHPRVTGNVATCICEIIAMGIVVDSITHDSVSCYSALRAISFPHRFDAKKASGK